MASNQPTQAITVIPSDTINIPEPGSYLTGNNTGTGTTLTTAGAKFLGTFNAGNTGYSNRVAAILPPVPTNKLKPSLPAGSCVSAPTQTHPTCLLYTSDAADE